MQRLTNEEMIKKINKLKKERNAIILTHNYQLAEAHEVADFVGDSLELSIKAANVDADVIVFCGVTFMAETANILSPEKTVLLPNLASGCPMADMATAEELKKLKAEHPNALVVTYVNSSAEVKALSDVCVTSANALKIVSALPKDKKIIFVPDKNLGAHVAKETGRDMILWDGYCPTHMRINAADLQRRKNEFPDAKVIVHPESQLNVIGLADEALSTGGMLRYVKENKPKQVIVCTELGMIYRLQKENPETQFILASEQAVCPTMKMHCLEDILASLEKMENKIVVPEEIRIKAALPIKKMIEMS